MRCKLERQKELYDKKAHHQPFEPGDLVWLHSSAVPHGQSRKLHRPWTGPYRIVSKLSDAVYRIQHSQTRRKCLVVHFDRLKACPPDIRLSKPAERKSREAAAPSPPLGTTLELLDCPDPDPPDSVSRNLTAPDPPARDQSAPDLPIQNPPVCNLPAPRYPCRERSAPARLYSMVRH